ncbi:MAG: EamA family transporter RarD [Mycobacteriaceae bacterium]|nr:EamA family transporter RarD [Mycobacteriaceae bacterium]
MHDSSNRRGMAYGAGAYAVWGLFPAFFGLLAFAGPVEILAHRIVWTMAVMLLALAVLGRLGGLRRIAPRMWPYAAAGTAAIALNWGVYVYAVTHGHVVEAALGYFINPLVSVLFGVILFRERLSRAQLGAVALAGAAVAALTVAYGRPPVIALILALSFGVYGLVKKLVPLDPLRSLAAESIVGFPFAAAYLGYLATAGTAAATHVDAHLLLLMACGPITTVPLLLFGAAAQRIPLVTIGILQYLTPSLQMAWGVVVAHESMTAPRWFGFAMIWCALAIFTADTLRAARSPARTAAERAPA